MRYITLDEAAARPQSVQRFCIVAEDEAQLGWSRRAAAFAARGRSTSADVVAPRFRGAPDQTVVSFGLGGRRERGLQLSDQYGRSWISGQAAASAIAAGADEVLVGLVDEDGRGVMGAIAVQRSVGATVAAGCTVLGPLLVQWANSMPARPVTQEWKTGPIIGRAHADRRGTARFIRRVMRAAVTTRNWQVARLRTPLSAILDNHSDDLPLQWHGPVRSAFWADPCVVRDGAQEWVFVEELPRRSGIGVIRACRWRNGELVGGEVVLSTGHHLSFPQIYRVGDRWLATVETCAVVNPVYEFDHLGQAWRPAADVPALEPNVADPVLVFGDDGEVRELWGTDASIDPDCVFVRFLLDADGWVRDDASTFVDVRRGRAGGTLDVKRGLRVVQDCSGTYGLAADIMDADGRSVRRFTADDLPPAVGGGRRSGVHTLSWWGDDELVWCDGWSRRFSPLGAGWRARERLHTRRCRG